MAMTESGLRNRRKRQTKAKPAATQQEQILWFNQLNHSDAYRVGGKGANLGECMSANLPVPNGFCITAAAFDHHLATHNLQVDTVDDLAAARNIMFNAPLDPLLTAAIAAAYTALGAEVSNDCPLVAVRSSATAEDGAAASFAGQMETLLGVSTAEEVVQAVRHCWASVFADRVAAYRNLAGGAGSCCVVVQFLVEADAAGVMFTANPLSGSLEEFVITANWGIGESVVADLTTPDTFVLDATTGSVVSTTIGKKTKMVVLVKKQDSNKIKAAAAAAAAAAAPPPPRVAMAEEVPVPLSQQLIPCLDANHLQSLLLLGRQVLSHYDDVPQDIEWAIVNDQVMLLQSRPITTLERRGEEEEDENGGSANSNNKRPGIGTVGEFDWHCLPDDWLTTCNAQEMFPGAGTPLTISMFGSAVEYGMQSLHMDYIRTMPGYNTHVLRTGWFNGHMFINMTNTLYMLTQMLGGEMGKQNGEMSILGRMNKNLTMNQLCQVHGTPWFPVRLLNSLGYLYAVRNAPSRVAIMRQRSEDAERMLGVGDHKNIIEMGEDGAETAFTMYERISSYRSEYNQQWADGIMCGSTSAAWMLLVMKLVCTSDEMWGTKRVSEIAGALVSDPNSDDQVESADALRQLDTMKIEISKHSDAKKFAGSEWDIERCQVWLETGDQDESDPRRQTITQMLRALLLRHGHRCVKEAELRNEDWGENPQVLVKLLKNSVKAHLKVMSVVGSGSGGNGGNGGSGGSGGSGSGSGGSEEEAEVRGTRDASSGREGKGGEKMEEEEEEDKLEILLKNEWSHIGCGWRPLLRYAVSCARAGVGRRELGKSLQIKVHSSMKRAFRWLGTLMVHEHMLSDSDLLYFLTFEEIGELVRTSGRSSSSCIQQMAMRAIKRRRLLPTQQRMTFPDLIQGKPMPHPPRAAVAAGGKGFQVVGTPVSRGDCEGLARVVRTLDEAGDLEPGEVLICPFTDVGWTPYFSLASGLVTEIGGLLSHGAVVAREYGLPCVVNVENACSRFRTGMLVRVEGKTGTVTVM